MFNRFLTAEKSTGFITRPTSLNYIILRMNTVSIRWTKKNCMTKTESLILKMPIVHLNHAKININFGRQGGTVIKFKKHRSVIHTSEYKQDLQVMIISKLQMITS
jgi:hypothetical protein